MSHIQPDVESWTCSQRRRSINSTRAGITKYDQNQIHFPQHYYYYSYYSHHRRKRSRYLKHLLWSSRAEPGNRLIRVTGKPSASPLKQLKSDKLPPSTINGDISRQKASKSPRALEPDYILGWSLITSWKAVFFPPSFDSSRSRGPVSRYTASPERSYLPAAGHRSSFVQQLTEAEQNSPEAQIIPKNGLVISSHVS